MLNKLNFVFQTRNKKAHNSMERTPKVGIAMTPGLRVFLI